MIISRTPSFAQRICTGDRRCCTVSRIPIRSTRTAAGATRLPNSVRSPSKCFALNRTRMPIAGGVYSPDVLVFRASEARGYAFLPAPVPLSFVAVSAYNNPPTTTAPNGELVLSGKVEQNTRRKMRAIFGMAAENGGKCSLRALVSNAALSRQHRPRQHRAERIRLRRVLLPAAAHARCSYQPR